MGNTPSVAEPREQHRLSKPKTYTGASSTSLLSSPLKTQLHGSGSRSTIHVGYDEKDTAIEEEEDLDSSEGDSLGELASSVRDRLSCLSRSGSTISHTPNARVPPTKVDNAVAAPQSSLVPEVRHVDIGAALAILQEIKKNASPEDLMALREALSPAEPDEQVAELPQRRIEDSVRMPSSSLIRRRSLATPGLATRGKSHERLRKTRTLTEDRLRPPRSHVWRMDMFHSSPLMELGAAESSEGGRESPGPRAQTPSDMDYSHLGTLKLGSLVVTNGAASPTPGAMSRNLPAPESIPEVKGEVDYFTAPVEREGVENPVRNPASHPEEHEKYSGQVARTKDRETGRADEPETSNISGTGSPLKQGLHQMDVDDDRSYYELPSRAPSQLVLDRSAPSIAADYIVELPTGPYAAQDGPPAIVSAVETVTACGTDGETEDQLSEEARAFREEAFCILNGTNFSQEFMLARQTTRSGSTQPADEAAKLERPAQAKTDSGYSSSASLRATKSSISSEGASGGVAGYPGPAKDSRSDDSTEVPCTFEQILNTSVNGPSATPSSLPASNPKPVRLSVLRGKSWKKPSRPNLLKRPSSEVICPPKPFQDSDPKNPPKAKRLHKLRPKSHQPLTVQTSSTISGGSVPNVPSDVVAAFSQRLVMSPGMEHLTRTYASVAHTDAGADADEEVEDGVDYSISIRFPSSNRSSIVDSEPHESAPTPPKHRYVASTSKLRNEFNPSSNHEESPCVADFGTVTQSFGGSPYDIATAALAARVPSAPFHPHQDTAASPPLGAVVELEGTDPEFVGTQYRRCEPLPARTQPQLYGYYELEANEAQRPALSSLQTAWSYEAEPAQTSHSSHPSSSTESGVIRRDSPATNFSRPHSIKSPSSASGGKQSPAQGFRTSVHSSNPSRQSSIGHESPVATPVPSHEQTQQPDWEAHALMWRARCKSIGERVQPQVASPGPPSIVVSRYVTPTLPPSALAALPSSVSALPEQRPPQRRMQSLSRTRSSSPPPRSPHRSSALPPLIRHHPSSIASAVESPIVDRYNGGLEYGFERGFGVGGSAGTRDLRSAASRKSLVVSHQFGVDLSDVPVFLRRA